jgi:hypothetical protein
LLTRAFQCTRPCDAPLRAQGLLDECDDSCDVWFTLALAHHGGCSFERARNCLDEAQEVRICSMHSCTVRSMRRHSTRAT